LIKVTAHWLIILLVEGRTSTIHGLSVISVHDPVTGKAFGELRRFRREFYQCLTARADAMFELADAVLCADGPVRSLAELSLVGEHRRGHGSSYAALADGRIDVERLRTALTTVPLPRAADGRLVLAVDITCWLRPDAHTSPERILCHTYGRGKDQAIMIPGWPYSMVVALQPGRSSWTAPLDAQRLAPGEDAATVTATQLRQLLGRLIAAGQWQPGDPDILIVADAGYDGPRLAWLLKDLPVQVLARMRADRVLRRAAPPWVPGPKRGRPPRHGGEFIFGDPASFGEPDVTTTTDTRLYGTATAQAWNRLHPRLTRRAAWIDSEQLPLIEGTVIRLQVDRLPSGAAPSRCGCGGRAPMPAAPTSTGCGRRTCAASTSSTPSACGSRRWAGPARRPAPRRPPTGGPGSSSPPTPNYASPVPSRPTCAGHGRNRSRRNGCHRPASVADFGTCARGQNAQPRHPNPAGQDRGGHPADATPNPPHATTFTSPPP
jgi:hypothetical protein